MTRYVAVVLSIVMMAATAVFAGACGMQPGGTQQDAGKMHSESKSVDLENAQTVRAKLQMGAGEMHITGGADQLMDGDFSYNVSEWKPKVSYDVSIEGGVGEATVLLPSEVGVKAKAEGGLGKINAKGLEKVGDSYVNDAYGESDTNLSVDVKGGVGEINLEVV